jgi:glycosyltransferase involved in cell wall biosynthesis
VILEALASGTPVITTRAAGAAEYIDESSGTVLEDADDAEALPAAIEAWLKRAHASEVDRDAIRARVAHLDLERCHETLERLVLELAR